MYHNKTALVLIATGEQYVRYAKSLIDIAKECFVPHDVLIFTDSNERLDAKYQIYRENLGYPEATLMRYHAVCEQRELLSTYEYIFYCDVDMRFVRHIRDSDIFSDGITATEHPGHVGLVGTPETNPDSTAYLLKPRTYFCGGFNGGTSAAYLQMAEAIREAVDIDKSHGITAIWHDESHLNRYLYDHPPARILTSEFCWPDLKNDDFYVRLWHDAHGPADVIPKLLALSIKRDREVKPYVMTVGPHTVDLNHPEFVSYLSPQAPWKQALIMEFARRFNLTTLVETGTCYGDTIAAVRSSFTNIWSVELSTKLHAASSRRFAEDSGVHLKLGSSGEELPGIIAQTTGPLLFWLDAHITTGAIGNGDQTTMELEAIRNLRPDSLVLIDDVKYGQKTWEAPDAEVATPKGWKAHFFSGVLVLHAGGYAIPDRF